MNTLEEVGVWIGILVGVVPIITFIYFLYDRYKKAKLDVNSKNIFFARINDASISLNENWGMVFYFMNILNTSTSSFTLKEIELTYIFEKKTHTTFSHVIKTALYYEDNEKKDIPCAAIQVSTNFMVLKRWTNLRTEIAKNKVIEPGAIFSTSAYFLLDLKEYEKLNDLKKIKLVATTHFGRKMTKKISIEKDWIEKSKNNYLLNKKFVFDNNRDIKLI